MTGAVFKSALWHIAAILFAWAGLPILADDPPPGDPVIIVEMVSIAEMRNLPVATIAPPVSPVEVPPSPAAEPEAALTTAAALPSPVALPEPAPALPAVPEPEPAPAADPAPESPSIPSPPPRPAREAAPEPEREEVARLPDSIDRPKRKPRPPQFDFDRALERIDDIERTLASREPEAPENERPREAAPDPVEHLLARADDPYRADTALTMTEIDAIRAQIQRNWAVPAGAESAHEMTVTLRLRLGIDGTVQSVEVVETARMERDSFFRTMAESAVRAVRRTARIDGLSADSYRLWRDIEMRFNPKDMFG